MTVPLRPVVARRLEQTIDPNPRGHDAVWIVETLECGHEQRFNAEGTRQRQSVYQVSKRRACVECSGEPPKVLY